MADMVRAISTLYAGLNRQSMAARLNERIAEASQEVSTGKKADVYGALGRSSAEILSMRMAKTRNDGFLVSNGLLQARFDTKSAAMEDIRKAGQAVLDQAISSREEPGATVATLQQAARSAIEQIVNGSQQTFQGSFLFSGTKSSTAPLQKWDETNSATGLSPWDVVEGVTGGAVTDAADAQAKADALAAIFADDPTAPAGQRFEATFYNGSPAEDGAGNPTPRAEARVAENVTLDHGAQANDPFMRDMLRGLSMIASADPASIDDPAAYREWMTRAVDSLSGGLDELRSAESALGRNQGRLKDIIGSQNDRDALLSNEISGLEGADPYEAASRLTMLQSQLEATYAVTARLSQLSFLNFMR